MAGLIIGLAIGAGAGKSTSGETTTVVRTVVADGLKPNSAPGTTKDGGSASATSSSLIGQTHRVEFDDVTLDVTVTNLERAKPSQFTTVKGVLFAVTVRLRVISGSYDANPLYWAARDNDGNEFSAALGGVDDQLATSQIREGQQLQGRVPFDVPVDKKISLIVFTGIGGDQISSWSA